MAFLLHGCVALSPLAPGAILDESGEHAAPSYEIFSRDRLREEHIRRLMANTALEAPPQPCPANCSFPEGGFCDVGSGVCFCNRGWQGSDCSEELPCRVANCSGHGTCVRGSCQCELGSYGDACELNTCPHHCHASAGRGHCVLGTCACEHGWSGASCSSRPMGSCLVDAHGLVCSGHGTCDVEGACTCFHAEYTGADCSLYAPPLTTNEDACAKDGAGRVCGGPERGRCPEGDTDTAKCECKAGFSGIACASDDCFVNATDPEGIPSGVACGGHGNCTAADPDASATHWYCACESGYVGADCTEACPLLCSGHGDCSLVLAPLSAVVSLAQQIVASVATTLGSATVDTTSSPRSSPSPDAGHDAPLAMHAVCTCHRGWEGVGCAQPAPCPSVTTVVGYNASTSDPATCVPGEACCGHGECVLGECNCHTDFNGEACARYAGVEG